MRISFASISNRVVFWGSADLRERNEGSEQYLSMLRTTIARAEAVAGQLTQQAGGTDQKMTVHPDLVPFVKAKKVAQMPIAKPQILVVDDEEMGLMLVKQ